MIEIPTKTDFAQQIQDKNLSLKHCELCNREVGVRDVRARPILCFACIGKKSAMGRYTNFEHGKLTQQEKQRILGDKTTRRGPFGVGK